MSKTEEKTTNVGSYEVEVKASRRPRFKAGSELSGKVNLVAVDVTEECTADEHLFELKLEIEIPVVCASGGEEMEKVSIGTRVRKTMSELKSEIRTEVQNKKNNG